VRGPTSVTAPASTLVTAATQELDRALGPALGADWSVPAGDVEWSCRRTAGHIADDLFSYASQVIAQPREGYLPIEAVLEPDASNEDLVRAVSMCGRLLRHAVEAAAPGDRAWHPYGTSDPEGFAAMGVVETLVHTYDIARGLGLDWRPPPTLCAPVLARLFPEAPDGRPTDVLLYCTGRAELPGLPRLSGWSWDSSVRADRDGSDPDRVAGPRQHDRVGSLPGE
jgi:hypothetical protein